MTNPLSWFFSLGDKVTKGDPVRKADYDYYMMWIIFLAFFAVFAGNIWEFVKFQKFQNLGWALFGLAIMWFQYQGLRATYEMKKIVRKQVPTQEKVESMDDMLKHFDRKKKKDGK